MKQKERSLNKASALCSLDPFIDGKGILRVGRRIGSSRLHEEYMYPMILPKKSKVTELIIKLYHLKVAQRGITLNEIRDRFLDYQYKFHNKISSV